MEGCSRKFLLCIVASLLGLAGVLLCLVGPALPAGAQDFRALQVWPDRSIGVTSGQFEDSTAYTATQVFPFGVYRASDGDVVHARTYLHFPLDVFPPGTDILHATLYVYVDSGSGTGEAILGAYRILDPWQEGEGDWGADPVVWPALLTAPIATTVARLDAGIPALPVSTLAPTVTPTFTATPTLTATETSKLFPKPAGHGLSRVSDPAPPSLTSPLATPTSPGSPLPTSTPIPTPTPTSAPTSTPGPTPTSAPTSTPGATPTSGASPTPSAAPLPTPTSSLSPTVPVLPLEQAAGTWLTWDVTALMRAWLAGEVPDDGLALAPAPDPDADPETAGDLLVARWLAADDPNTRPHLIVEFDVQPVTPTPTFVPILPPAGSSVRWGPAGVLLVGAASLILGLLIRRRFLQSLEGQG